MKMCSYIVILALVLGVNISNGQYFSSSNACTNPNGRTGICEPIHKCSTLMSVVMRKPLREEDRAFLRASSCKNSYYGQPPFVCCTWDTEFKRTRRQEIVFWEPPTTQRSRISYDDISGFRDEVPTRSFQWQGRPQSTTSSNRASLPAPPTCGGVTITNKILGGTDADLYEFPWMALLVYNRKSGMQSTHCAGSLINQRYVLTAAHCVTGPIEKAVGKLTAVRLGEHDTLDKSTTEAVRVPVEEVVSHSGYNGVSNDLSNDIALVRLQHDVAYTNAIRPICLPSKVVTQKARIGTAFTVAGWGTTLQSVRASVKQKLDVKLVSLEQCRRKFLERNVEIGETQMCAGSKFSEDSCEGDSGGPLMRLNGAVWVLEGIVSFGYKCGLEGWPGVYTRVSSFNNWISDNMRP